MTASKSKFLFLILFALLLTNPATAKDKKLTYKQAYEYSEPDLLGKLPNILAWHDEDHYLEKKYDEEKNGFIYFVDAESGDEEIFMEFRKYDDVFPEGLFVDSYLDNSDDFSLFLHYHRDIFLFDRKTAELKQLTAGPVEELNITLSPDGKYVAFVKENDLYVINTETGLERQLTSDGSDVILNGRSSWVYYEEILGRSTRYKAFWWSPDSKKIAFMKFDESDVPEFPLYIADGKHGEIEWQRYPKAGDPNPEVRLRIADVGTGAITRIDEEEYQERYLGRPFWSPDSKNLFMQWMNRGQDKLLIYKVNPKNGKKEVVYTEQQDSWVEFVESILFTDDEKFIFTSDKNGKNNIFLVDYSKKKTTGLSDDKTGVIGLISYETRTGSIYFYATGKNTTEQHLFRIGIDGSGMKQLTEEPGTHNCNIAPGGEYFIDTYSNINTPRKMLLKNSEGRIIRQLGDSKLPEFDEYELGKTEIFPVQTSDGAELPALWILPPDFDPTKKYPLIIKAYGGPEIKSVRNYFRYRRGRLADYWLAQNGIIIMVVDHRGAGHHGKTSASLMHRRLGKWELNDYSEAVQWLWQQPFIDSTRIGIEGGSYGGYVAALALTKGAEYFTHGIAEFSVTDWRLYDNVYTERYMDLPRENPIGYDSASVMTYADKYRGNLLITHGTIDDNVHMQHTIQLIDILQTLNKKFELMVYPNERHGIRMRSAHYSRENVSFWFRHFFGRDPDFGD